jgi:allophanate hydrolase subunit 1
MNKKLLAKNLLFIAKKVIAFQNLAIHYDFKGLDIEFSWEVVTDEQRSLTLKESITALKHIDIRVDAMLKHINDVAKKHGAKMILQNDTRFYANLGSFKGTALLQCQNEELRAKMQRLLGFVEMRFGG